MATLQVKGMDGNLYEALKRRAELDNRSISQEVIAIIQTYLAQPTSEAEHATREFLKLSREWAGTDSAEQTVRDIRTSRQRRRGSPRTDDVFD